MSSRVRLTGDCPDCEFAFVIDAELAEDCSSRLRTLPPFDFPKLYLACPT